MAFLCADSVLRLLSFQKRKRSEFGEESDTPHAKRLNMESDTNPEHRAVYQVRLVLIVLSLTGRLINTS